MSRAASKTCQNAIALCFVAADISRCSSQGFSCRLTSAATRTQKKLMYDPGLSLCCFNRPPPNDRHKIFEVQHNLYSACHGNVSPLNICTDIDDLDIMRLQPYIDFFGLLKTQPGKLFLPLDVSAKISLKNHIELFLILVHHVSFFLFRYNVYTV